MITSENIMEHKIIIFFNAAITIVSINFIEVLKGAQVYQTLILFILQLVIAIISVHKLIKPRRKSIKK